MQAVRREPWWRAEAPPASRCHGPPHSRLRPPWRGGVPGLWNADDRASGGRRPGGPGAPPARLTTVASIISSPPFAEIFPLSGGSRGYSERGLFFFRLRMVRPPLRQKEPLLHDPPAPP